MCGWLYTVEDLKTWWVFPRDTIFYCFLLFVVLRVLQNNSFVSETLSMRYIRCRTFIETKQFSLDLMHITSSPRVFQQHSSGKVSTPKGKIYPTTTTLNVLVVVFVFFRDFFSSLYCVSERSWNYHDEEMFSYC